MEQIQAELVALRNEIAHKDKEIRQMLEELGVQAGDTDLSWLWHCSSCTVLNISDDSEEHPSMQKCVICLADRFPDKSKSVVTEKPQTRIADPPSTTLSQQRVRTVNDWTCKACTWVNKSDDLECAICYADRADSTLVGWRCEACMTMNDEASDECSVCYADRPQSKDCGWKCPACMTMNDMASTECSVCYADRPVPQGPLAGPWVCIACRSLVRIDQAMECDVCYGDRTTGSEWRCLACFVVNPSETQDCLICYASNENDTADDGDDEDYEQGDGPVDTIDLNDGKRLMMDAQLTKKLLRIPKQAELVKVVKLSSKSFGEDASKVASERLSKLSNLEVADFSDIISGRPTDEALDVIARLCGALHLDKLKELNVSANALGERGMRVLTPTLQGCAQNIETLVFRTNGFSAESLGLFNDAIGTPPRLQALHFESNMSGSKGAIALQPFFERISSFSTLAFRFSMVSCRVQPDGCQALAKSLRVMGDRVVFLDLSDCTMKDLGGQELAKTLAHTPNLEELILKDVDFGKQAKKEVASSLDNLKKLQVLDLSENELNDTVGEILVSKLAKLSDLKRVELNGNCFSQKMIDSFTAKLPNILIGSFDENDFDS